MNNDNGIDLPNISTESSEVQVIGADVEACQGVVHVIDGVLLPLSEEEFETLEDSPVPEPISEGPGRIHTKHSMALEMYLIHMRIFSSKERVPILRIFYEIVHVNVYI